MVLWRLRYGVSAISYCLLNNGPERNEIGSDKYCDGSWRRYSHAKRHNRPQWPEICLEVPWWGVELLLFAIHYLSTRYIT